MLVALCVTFLNDAAFLAQASSADEYAAWQALQWRLMRGNDVLLKPDDPPDQAGPGAAPLPPSPIVRLMLDDASAAEIAEQLNLTRGSVAQRYNAIFYKVGVSDQHALRRRIKRCVQDTDLLPYRGPDRRVHDLLASLSTRERETLRYELQDLTVAEVARRLYISETTIYKHRENIRSKFGVPMAEIRRMVRPYLFDDDGEALL